MTYTHRFLSLFIDTPKYLYIYLIKCNSTTYIYIRHTQRVRSRAYIHYKLERSHRGVGAPVMFDHCTHIVQCIYTEGRFGYKHHTHHVWHVNLAEWTGDGARQFRQFDRQRA
jgi:hypothetical protein